MQLQSRQAKAQRSEEGRLVVDALALVLILPIICMRKHSPITNPIAMVCGTRFLCSYI